MSDRLPPIYFYIPKDNWPSVMPKSADSYWQWQNSTGGAYRSGKYNWTLQTYLYLKADGFDCELIDSIPDEGIVVAHRDFLPFNLKPTPSVLFVCIQADRPNHPYAQLHLVQNPEDEKLSQPVSLWNSHYIPYWSQPELIPRDQARGDRFENVGYFGIRYNLAPELKAPSWEQQLNALGLRWQVIPPNRWNDYSDIDVVIAVRSFDYQGSYIWKPASKLVNAWHAGVPIILGRESAYQFLRQSEFDYLEADSITDLISALKRLRDDKELRHAIIENGFVRAETTQPAKLVVQWRDFLTNVATPAYQRWRTASSLSRQIFLQRRFLIIKMDGMKRRLGNFVSYTPKDNNWN